MNILIFDTETTGKYDFKLPPDHPTQPHLVQIAALMKDEFGKVKASIELIVKPEGWNISEEVVSIHGITDEIANSCGVSLRTVGFLFNNLCYQSDLLVAHNIDFDRSIMQAVYSRLAMGNRLSKMNRYCTMRSATPIVKAQRAERSNSPRNEHNYKWPTLTECMEFFFQEKHVGAHNAMADVMACARVYDALKELGV